MENDLVGMLLSTPAVAQLVANRVWPNARPQGVPTPCVVVRKISGGRDYADDGEIGIAPARMQLDCSAATYTDAKRLARLVIAKLSNFVGVYGETDFRLVTLDDEREDREGGTNNAEYLHRVSLDFLITYAT